MRFFNDSNLSLQDAINYYINYVEQHEGKVSPDFRNNLRISILEGNETLAQANANVETNTIKLRKNISIVTLFHELRHISDQWKDESNGKKYACWEYEKNYSNQMVWENQNNQTVRVQRGIHGRYIGEAVAELYASKVYWEMCGNSAQAHQYTKYRTYYDEEIINLKKICTILGISEDIFINLKSDNDYARNLLRKRCKQLTGNENTWDILEDNLDFIEMDKVIKTSHPNFRISQVSQKSFQNNRKNVNNIYDYILGSSLKRGKISEQEYNSILRELEKLDSYLDNSLEL